MNWVKIKNILWFIFIYGLAINLIEYDAEGYITELSCDLFGGLALMFLAIDTYLNDN